MIENVSPTKTGSSVGLSARHLDFIQKIVAQVFRDTSCVVYLFGSRARGTHTLTSDVDIAIASPEHVGGKLGALREALEFSTLPLFVDVVDLNQVGTTFLEEVKNEGIVIWKN